MLSERRTLYSFAQQQYRRPSHTHDPLYSARSTPSSSSRGHSLVPRASSTARCRYSARSATRIAPRHADTRPSVSTILFVDSAMPTMSGTSRHSSSPTVPLANGRNSSADRRLESMKWYHGPITREYAENLLSPCEDGLFLVRESTNYPGDHTLCVCFDDKVEHYRIIHQNDRVTIDEEEVFDSLSDLIEHYSLQSDGLCTNLRRQVPRRDMIAQALTPKAFRDAGYWIDANDLKIGEPLGKGEYADVLIGTLTATRTVAVKMLKEESPAKEALLAEAWTMTCLQHPNLVSFFGICTQEGRLCLVTEYMSNGSMLEYLRSRGRQCISARDLLGFAVDIICGMTYLESREYVHRDLAARNVLLNGELRAKVSDFGHTRKLSQAGVQSGKLPIKWTAPEALRRNEFSSKSDVWSFGILLWELYSFGRAPYPRITIDQVQQLVEKGHVMEAPDACPDSIYDMMRSCWQLKPAARPTFAILSWKLHDLRSNLPA